MSLDPLKYLAVPEVPGAGESSAGEAGDVRAAKARFKETLIKNGATPEQAEQTARDTARRYDRNH